MSITIIFSQPDGGEQAITVDQLDQNLMEVARSHAVAGIAADCGGACACATCHVHIDPAWIGIVGPCNSVEADMLDLAAEMTAASRLACQIQLRQEFDGLRVTVPA